MSDLDPLVDRLETLATDFRALANAFATAKVGKSGAHERLGQLLARTEGMRDALLLSITKAAGGERSAS